MKRNKERKDSDFWRGFRKGFFQIDDVSLITPELQGELSFAPILALVTSIVCIVAVRKRKKSWWIFALVLLGFHVFGTLGSIYQVPILSFAIFLLMLRKQGKQYLTSP